METATNVAILVTCAFIVVVLTWRLLSGHASHHQRVRPMSVAVGDSLGTILAIDRTPPSRKPVLAVSERCPFCKASLPTYKRLIAERSETEVVVVADDPPATVAEYLRMGEVQADRIVSPVPRQLKIRARPTALLLDTRNRVLGVWEGQPSPDTEAQIRAALRGTPTVG